MAEILSAFKKEITKMFKSKVFWVWGTLIFSWLFWNWRIWYVTFFIDQKILKDLYWTSKIEYIEYFYQGFIHNLLYLLVLPLFSCFIIFYIFDFLVTKFVEKIEKNELARDRKISKIYKNLFKEIDEKRKKEEFEKYFNELYPNFKEKEENKNFIEKVKDWFKGKNS